MNVNINIINNNIQILILTLITLMLHWSIDLSRFK